MGESLNRAYYPNMPKFAPEEHRPLFRAIVLEMMDAEIAYFHPFDDLSIFMLAAAIRITAKRWEVVRTCSDPTGQQAILLAEELWMIPQLSEFLGLKHEALGRLWESIGVNFVAKERDKSPSGDGTNGTAELPTEN